MNSKFLSSHSNNSSSLFTRNIRFICRFIMCMDGGWGWGLLWYFVTFCCVSRLTRVAWHVMTGDSGHVGHVIRSRDCHGTGTRIAWSHWDQSWLICANLLYRVTFYHCLLYVIYRVTFYHCMLNVYLQGDLISLYVVCLYTVWLFSIVHMLHVFLQGDFLSLYVYLQGVFVSSYAVF